MEVAVDALKPRSLQPPERRQLDTCRRSERLELGRERSGHLDCLGERGNGSLVLRLRSGARRELAAEGGEEVSIELTCTTASFRILGSEALELDRLFRESSCPAPLRSRLPADR